MRIATLSLVAMLLSGCTTVLLPNATTGRCYRLTHAYVVGTFAWLGDAIDGWRCKGMQEGDLALVGDKPGMKPATPR